MNQPLTPERIMQTGMGFWASKALLSAVELEIFTLKAAAARFLNPCYFPCYQGISAPVISDHLGI